MEEEKDYLSEKIYHLEELIAEKLCYDECLGEIEPLQEELALLENILSAVFDAN